MVKIIVEGKKSFYLSKQLKKELDTALYAVKSKNQDLVIVIDGDEGAGKSQTSRMVGFYCAKVLGSFFDLDGVTNIHNSLEKYIKTSIDGEKYMVNILDESRKVLNRKRSTSKDAVRFTDYLSECRSKNQVHILLLPTYHDLDRYVAQWRMSLVIHMFKMWTPDEKVELGGHELHLGAFRLYINTDAMRYFYDQKGFRYPRQFICKDRFSNCEVLTEKGKEAYENQKEGLVKSKYLPEDDTRPEQLLTDKRLMTAFERDRTLRKMSYNSGRLCNYIKDVYGVPYTQIAEFLKVDKSVISKWVSITRKIEAQKSSGVDLDKRAFEKITII